MKNFKVQMEFLFNVRIYILICILLLNKLWFLFKITMFTINSMFISLKSRWYVILKSVNNNYSCLYECFNVRSIKLFDR